MLGCETQDGNGDGNADKGAEQTTREAKAALTASVTRRVIARASNFGIQACRRDCTGRTIAMMKSASASGANTLLAVVTAARISTPKFVKKWSR